MTAPTQPVTINLADYGGPATAGIEVTGKPSDVDYTADGIIVSSKPVTGVSGEGGTLVLQCFPNALVANGGLGTRGTTIRFTAKFKDSKRLDVLAVIPNHACNLVDCIVDDEPIALAGSERAAAQAQAYRDLAKAWATKTDGEVVAGQGYGAKKYAQDAADEAEATADDRQQTGLDREQTGEDRSATGQDRTQTGIDRGATAADRGAVTTARIATENARDTALALLKRYPDTATAIADGTLADLAYFSTPSPLSIEAAIIWRKVSGAAVIDSRVPSSELLSGFDVSYEADLCGVISAQIDVSFHLITSVDLAGVWKAYYTPTLDALNLGQLNLGSLQLQGLDGFEVDLCGYLTALVDGAGGLIDGKTTASASLDTLVISTLLSVTGTLALGSYQLQAAEGYEADLCGVESAIIDAGGRTLAGTAAASGSAPAEYQTDVSSSGDMAFVKDVGGVHQVATYDASVAKTTVITNVGSNVAPKIISGRRVIYTSSRNGLVSRYWQDLVGSTEWPFDPTQSYGLWGDSITAAGSGYGAVFALSADRAVYNQGIGGQRTRQIAQRMGAVATTCTVTGGSIPISGAVAITGITLLEGSSNATIRCTIAGVAGVLAFAVADTTYAFTRDVAGTAVSAAGAVPLVPTSGLALNPDFSVLLPSTTFICNGRNDIGKVDYNAAQVLADTTAMVNTIKSVRKQYLIIGPVNGMVDVPTSMGGTWAGTDANALVRLLQAKELNDLMRTQFGPFYVDVIAAAKAQGFTTNYVVSGTAFDVINNTWSSDGLHPADATGKPMLSTLISTTSNGKGY